jgi:hypothetical protein
MEGNKRNFGDDEDEGPAPKRAREEFDDFDDEAMYLDDLQVRTVDLCCASDGNCVWLELLVNK